ncbi:aggregation factor core protein MAFp3, isoform C [Tateyamaria pelophila]|uniref:aggregation factor core protein MAFp3, isoform C n=1 Tax=Tateyamaria pelophila TaxID=328415 RepID=UPI001CBB45DD|nr:aggregation factor core protein MAFp3, isoform C [Tateyamaria pelophila]
MRPTFLSFVCVAALGATAATADVTVTFRDGAPKDRFTITQTGACATGPVVLKIDVGTAPTGLIFDTTDTGAGVDVFQPFEWVSAPSNTATVPQVGDGDTTLELSLPDLKPDVPLVFTIDLDDTTSTRQITVSGSEIAGAQVSLMVGTVTSTGIFDAKGKAVIATSACRS